MLIMDDKNNVTKIARKEAEAMYKRAYISAINKIKCPNKHNTTRYLYSFKDEINYEDIPIFYCWTCKEEFSFR
jgi:hypothetical protein